MVKKFIAVSIKGKEYMLDKSRMIAVPTSSAKKIADTLNEQKYLLRNENEVWYPHENDYYFDGFIGREIKRYGKRMPVYSYYG